MALEGLIAARRSSPEERGAVDELTLSLGVLFARYARGELALGELLRQGGVQADCANATPPCEEYYELLTALERDEGAREQIAAAAERLFAAPHQRAARELARIGITI